MAKRIVSVRVVIEHDDDPDLSYLEQDWGNEEDNARDAQRLAEYGNAWHMIYLCAEAEIDTQPEVTIRVTGEGIETVRSLGIGGVESDSGEDYFKDIIDFELKDLAAALRVGGFDDDEVNEAMRWAER